MKADSRIYIYSYCIVIPRGIVKHFKEYYKVGTKMTRLNNNKSYY